MARRLILFILAISTTTGSHLRQNVPEIIVHSNRADLVSGGDALVQIRLASDSHTAGLEVYLNDEDIRSAFDVRPGGRIMGLVAGLKEGENELRVDGPGGAAQLTITNHPIGGPIFSGPQLQPWICDTEAGPYLGPAVDVQCNAPTLYRYVYRTSAGEFAEHDPFGPMPDDLVMTTTDHGLTVPYIVRIERGTMNRGIHEIAVLFDPDAPWSPWAGQPQWNRKLVVQYGFGTSQLYRQGVPLSVLNHEALSAGFAVVSSSMLSNAQHANFVTAAETTMMLKEHIIETYGPIRYTIGRGASGGALLQHLIADSYPGLLDGLLPLADWEDSISGAYREFADSGLLSRAFETSSLSYSIQEREAIGGWGAGNSDIFVIESRRIADYNRPDDETNCAGEDSYDSIDNPDGVRCTFQDFMASILGRREQDGYAHMVFDNQGVQYGLVAFQSGQLSSEKFVDLNARVGGYDVNGEWQPQRSEIDPAVAGLLHRTGQVTFGRQLGKVAELVVRTTNNNDYHYPFRTYVHRNRLIAANGHADNHVFWISPPASLSALEAMDRWLAAVEMDDSSDPMAVKVLRNKPDDLSPACWIDGIETTDIARCDAVYPYFREPRTVAGDVPTISTMKCRLKPLRREDYDAAFTDAQWETLNNAFPTGVCDFSEPGIGFQPNIPWLTYTDGPGGRPLGEPPVSTPSSR